MRVRRPAGRERRPAGGAEARRRAAVELVARHEASLRRTARRFSLDAEDAEDALQRALEIVLTKAPTTDPEELIRWTQTVTRHEALAVRRSRERLLGKGMEEDGRDRVAALPSPGDGPAERAELREEMARSREALRALKPAELRALGLLAEGYSYTEIGEITGFSQTKVNRLLAEGRSRYRDLVSRSEDGSRCRELRPLLSAFCDGEASPAESDTVREHLRACLHCRATMRAYRRAPRIAAALAPALPASRTLLERARDLLGDLGSRLPGGGGDSVAGVATASGSGGAGVAATAKLLAACAAGVGGVAACVATGVAPLPLGNPSDSERPPLERSVGPAGRPGAEAAARKAAGRPSRSKRPRDGAGRQRGQGWRDAAPSRAAVGSPAAGAVASEPAPAPAPEPAPEPTPTPAAPAEATAGPPGDGSAAGEFGP